MKFLVLLMLVSNLLIAKVPDIVPSSWLKQHYQDSTLVLIDVRDAKTYNEGHLKNAVNVPVFTKLFYGPNMLLPPLSSLKDTFSNAGINNQSQIVVYGGVSPIWSARFYWISKLLGANDVGILKVSYGNWKKGFFPISTKNFQASYQDFTPKINNSILKTKLDVLTSIGNAYIIDGRPPTYYDGTKSNAKRFGHIIKAINIPGSLTYQENGSKSSVKDFDKLKKLYTHLDRNKPIILYCEDGADAAMNFLVLKKLGYNASVYDGSWLEWANDNKLPIETGTKKK
jgi:thiosulfate/3-mercaptopyruvate sulfurtransferase